MVHVLHATPAVLLQCCMVLRQHVVHELDKLNQIANGHSRTAANMHAYMRNSIFNRAESNCLAKKKMYSVFLLLSLCYSGWPGTMSTHVQIPQRSMTKYCSISARIQMANRFFPVQNDYFCAVWARHNVEEDSSRHLNNSHFIASTRMEIIK